LDGGSVQRIQILGKLILE